MRLSPNAEGSWWLGRVITIERQGLILIQVEVSHSQRYRGADHVARGEVKFTPPLASYFPISESTRKLARFSRSPRSP